MGVGLVDIAYSKGYRNRYLYNTLRLGSEEIIFPVKHCETVFDLLTPIFRTFCKLKLYPYI
jgi:hypothetical protein